MSEKKYSTVYYWRYIFTPLLLLTLFFSLYILFTSSDMQSVAYTRIHNQILGGLSNSNQINSS
jgi:hypothetical protein